MMIEEIRNYCLEKQGVTESFPFDEVTLVFKVSDKIFLIIPTDEIETMFSVKTNPEWSEELRERYPQITGAFHMNKTHWNSVICNGLHKDLISKIIDHSYELVFRSLTKKKQQEISELS